jgi:hypothetical protein
MLPFDDNIIQVVDEAYRVGFNLPEKFFKGNPQNLNLESKEVYENYPLNIIKPEGIEFSYIIFWDGRRFLGGYISINNNYTGVQRGEFSRNGSTLFAGHVPEIKKSYKKLLKEEPMWIARAFILGVDNRIYYWGIDSVIEYSSSIYALTGDRLDDITSKFINKEKTFKPEGFTASILVKAKDVTPDTHTYNTMGKACDSISKAWKGLYNEVSGFTKEFEFTLGLEPYMRKAYSLLMVSNKIS